MAKGSLKTSEASFSEAKTAIHICFQAAFLGLIQLFSIILLKLKWVIFPFLIIQPFFFINPPLVVLIHHAVSQ